MKVAEAWAVDQPVPHATDDDFVNTFVTGRDDLQPSVTLRTAMLVAAFGIVRHSTTESATSELADWGCMTPDQMSAGIERLIDRGVVQRRGRDVVLSRVPSRCN